MARPPFLNEIELSWKQTIEDFYDKHRILSERTLQAALCATISARAGDRYVFIEPRISVPATDTSKAATFIPDIIVCRKKVVLAVIEVKFLPRGKVNLSRDLRKLETLASWLLQFQSR